MQQIIQARTAIESASLRALIIGLDTADGREILEQMEQLVSCEMPATLSDENNYNFMRADMEFHSLSIAFTGNEFFIKMMNMMRTRLEQAIFSSLNKQSRNLAAIDEHEKIFFAVKRRDTDGAIKAFVEHMNNTENILREMMDD